MAQGNNGGGSSQALTLIGGANRPWIERLAEREVVDAMKQTIAKGASDAQFLVFIEVAKATDLNPFLREIWWIPANGGQAVIAEDGWQNIANKCPHYRGYKVFYDYEDKSRSEHPVEGKRLTGCEVQIHRADRDYPHIGYALFAEYGKSVQESAAWKFKHTMLKNRAFCNAAREAFNVSGVYTEAELAEVEIVESRPRSQSEAMRDRFGVGGNGANAEVPHSVLQDDSVVEIPNEILTAEQEIAQRMGLIFEGDVEAAQAWLMELTGNRIKGQTSLVKNPDLIPVVLQAVRERCEQEGKHLPSVETPPSTEAATTAPAELPATTPANNGTELSAELGGMLEAISTILNELAGTDAAKRKAYMTNWSGAKVATLTSLKNYPDLIPTVLERARITKDEVTEAKQEAAKNQQKGKLL